MTPDGFLQIHDPLRPKGHAVGIDLGTTHSLVASVVQGRPRCLPADENDQVLLPSVVHYAENGSVVVGSRARQLAVRFPTDTIASVKRFMGKSFDDPETRRLGSYRFAPGSKVVRFQVAGGQPVNAIEVSAEILRALRRRAETYFAGKVERAVITVPAYFDDAQRQATRDAGRLAGLEVLRLLPEPTAAALAYGLDKGSQGTFAVYDLGGGTFDFSILKLVEGVFEVKAISGDSALGGDDFDREVAKHALDSLGLPATDPSRITLALTEARRARERLTTEERVTLALEGRELAVSREELEEWITPWVQKTGAACRRAMKDAGLEPKDLDGVILVGGATRTPFVRRFVRETFGKEPLFDLDPDQVVALGAAVQADLLTNDERRDEVLLLDVNPLSLGLETMGGVVEKLIPRNSTLPTAAAQVFTTFKDGQTGMDVHVVQGERELARDCRSLARFSLGGIPPMPAGMGRVEVTFKVDADGILSVSAKELSTGLGQSITVRPTHGLGDEEIEAMLIDAIDHAEADVKERFVTEQRTEAQRILMEIQRQLEENSDLLAPEERRTIDTAAERVTAACDGQDYLAIKESIAALDQVSRPFAERVMSRAISRALSGHKVEEFSP